MAVGKAVVKNADMDQIMQEDAVQIAAAAREKYEVDKDIATYVKQHFDRKYGRTWHCIVGKQYGSTFNIHLEIFQSYKLYCEFQLLLSRTNSLHTEKLFIFQIINGLIYNPTPKIVI
ncbi:unnamed protein product [Heterobilharzia americana]|nr:unnamed protein product [Heterobilharzia americana]